MNIAYGKAAIWGLVAGIVMAIVTMMITAVMGMGLWAMPAIIAGLILGPSAVMNVTFGVIMIGLIIHMALSMMFGVAYALIVNSATHEFVGTGVAFGIVLWLFNFYVIGLVLPGARMMAQHEPIWLAVISHLIFGFTLGALSRSSASAITSTVRI